MVRQLLRAPKARRAWAGVATAWRQAKPIAAYAGKYDNNFNLLRLIAAAMVILGHSYVLAAQHGRGDPLGALIGIDSGSFAVDIFFVISGFLVAKSYLGKNAVWPYLVARVLRIFPGLLIAILFNVLIVGIVFTELPIFHYLQQPETWQYLLTNSTLISRFVQLQYGLPGVFSTNPFGQAVNGSLWTLPYEVWMYIALLLGGILGILRNRKVISILFVGLVIVSTTLSLGLVSNPFSTFDNFIRFATFFGWGVVFYVNRFNIPVSGFIAAALILTAVLGWRTPFSQPLLFPAALTYAIFWLAYVPGGPIRKYNRLGDYSYGTYIYAFPVQQSAVALFPDILPLQLLGISLPMTLLLAVLSWHFIERPALRLKDRLSKLRIAGRNKYQKA